MGGQPHFFHKALKTQHTQTPQAIIVDKNMVYPIEVETLRDETLAQTTELWQLKYSNNVVEQADKNIKRITRVMMSSNCSTVREELWRD
jgi:transposase-like protein